VGHADTDPDRISPATRRGVHLFLLVFAITGIAHLELFPFSGFRLFAEVRGAERVAWQLRAVDGDGHEEAIRLGELPVAYRNTTTLLHEFPGLTAAERDRICDAWTQPARADGRPITSVRVYEVVESVRPDGPAPRRRLAYECGSGS
jgi:hypothetical protein